MTAQQELSSAIEVTMHANCRRAFPLSCFGAAACMIFAWTSFGGWTGGTSDNGAFVGKMLAGRIDANSTALVGKPLRCCARGFGGKPGVCLLGDPNGICCGSELALLCGAGSLCYTNGHNNPYCCGKHTSGCAHVCLDNSTRDNFVSSGGVCNPVSPQGFNADGTILYVEAPWDGNRMSYQLDGTHNITYVDPPIRLGTGDFTMTATVIPRSDAQADLRTVPLIRRIQRSPTRSSALTGYEMGIEHFDGASILYIEMHRSVSQNDRRLQIGRRLQSDEYAGAFFEFSVPILANVSISLRVVRQGLNLSGYVDNMPTNVFHYSSSTVLDVDTDLNAPLEISPRSSIDFPSAIRDLSITTAAEFP